MVVVITLLTNRAGLNSRNSRKPPSSDINLKEQARNKSEKKSGGQLGHVGTTLSQIEAPGDIQRVKIDRRCLKAMTKTLA